MVYPKLKKKKWRKRHIFKRETRGIHSPVKSLADPLEEQLSITGITKQALNKRDPVTRAKTRDIDLREVTSRGAEETTADAREGGEAFKGGPTEGLLIVRLEVPEGAGPGEGRLHRVPHDGKERWREETLGL